jgi:hypothetical protein
MIMIARRQESIAHERKVAEEISGLTKETPRVCPEFIIHRNRGYDIIRCCNEGHEVLMIGRTCRGSRSRRVLVIEFMWCVKVLFVEKAHIVAVNFSVDAAPIQ